MENGVYPLSEGTYTIAGDHIFVPFNFQYNYMAKTTFNLKEKGAKTVRALITHPVLSGKAYENIEGSVLEELVVCDTIPLKQQSDKIKVVTVADLFAIAIRNAYENKSITSLFVHAQLKARS